MVGPIVQHCKIGFDSWRLADWRQSILRGRIRFPSESSRGMSHTLEEFCIWCCEIHFYKIKPSIAKNFGNDKAYDPSSGQLALEVSS